MKYGYVVLAALALAAASIAQQPEEEPLRIEEFEQPYLLGMRELILGPLPHRHEGLGLYVDRGNKETVVTGDAVFAPLWFEVRVGWAGWVVTRAMWNGKPCMMVETNALLNQTLKRKGGEVLYLQNKQQRYWYIDDSGKLLRDHCISNMGGNVFEMDARFNEGDYELSITKPGGVTTVRTVYPACGIEPLTDIFKPMIVGGLIVRPSKEYWILDPLTGGPVKYKAKVEGRCSGFIFDFPVDGLYVDIDCGDRDERVFLSYEGKVLKIELDKGRYLLQEVYPEEPPLLRHLHFTFDNSARSSRPIEPSPFAHRFPVLRDPLYAPKNSTKVDPLPRNTGGHQAGG